MAVKEFTCTGDRPFSYMQYPWGDFIEGTKLQLQSLGIGVDSVFPGEEGGPKRKLRTLDPRGWKVDVCLQRDGRFGASIHFPDVPESPYTLPAWAPSPFPGVRFRRTGYVDEYIGTAEALVAAGLAIDAHLPGRPGMRKQRVTVLPDGTPLNGPPTAVHPMARAAGARQIERVSKTTYSVSVYVNDNERERRKKELDIKVNVREKVIASLPRPDRLDRLSGHAQGGAQLRRGHLRLVWSRG